MTRWAVLPIQRLADPRPPRQNASMRKILIHMHCAALAGATLSVSPAGVAQAPASGERHDEEPELAAAMSQLQTFTHKLALSIEEQNAELAGFYLHEAEETAAQIEQDIPDYEGHAIGPLVASMLMPQFERLDGPLDSTDWAAAEDVLGHVVNACNACHEATEHGFIVIEHRRGVNPFMQSFTPR